MKSSTSRVKVHEERPASSPPPPPPPNPSSPNSHARFMNSLAIILAGNVPTPRAELFCPLTPHMAGQRVLGIADSRAKELYSLSQNLIQEARQIPIPKTLEAMKVYETRVGELALQAKQASELFWQEIRGTVPGAADCAHICIHDGWRVVASCDEEGELESFLERLASQQNLPKDMVKSIFSRESGAPRHGRE